MHSTWYLREAGLLTRTSTGIADPAPLLRYNAFAKLWRREELTDSEREALAEARRFHVQGSPVGDVALGALAHFKPDILERLDAMAEEVATVLGFPTMSAVLAWMVVHDYTGRALAAVEGETLQALPAIDLDHSAAEAWEASAKGQAAIARMVPDGGPEGWSQVAPCSPTEAR